MRRIVIQLSLGLLVVGMTTPAFADAAGDFKKNCSTCHGKDGRGKTKMGERLGVKDFTDPAVQASFTDKEAEDAITNGINDKKTGKTRMKGKKGKLSPAQIKALVKFVRSLKKG